MALKPTVCLPHPHNPLSLIQYHLTVWSLGMLMYELLTLKRPYYDVPYLQISEFNAAGIRPMVPEEVAKEYKEIITLFDKCICKEPSKRPSAKRLITKLGKL